MPRFQTEESNLQISALTFYCEIGHRSYDLPSPPPRKHSLPAHDCEMHYVTWGIGSKSYFWRRRGGRPSPASSWKDLKGSLVSRRSGGTATSETCLDSSGCPLSWLSPQAALQGAVQDVLMNHLKSNEPRSSFKPEYAFPLESAGLEHILPS